MTFILEIDPYPLEIIVLTQTKNKLSKVIVLHTDVHTGRTMELAPRTFYQEERLAILLDNLRIN